MCLSRCLYFDNFYTQRVFLLPNRLFKHPLRQVYQEAALDLAIDYSVQPVPALSESDFQWVRSLMES
ncbi:MULTISPECIES: DUF4058 family protein [unclassified Moorena]|uniref:DUF4058 family protein n=1 Tax=unclassified Moorena TaxID=2683338 RepID=UPI0013C02B31|nr:MULTISPECIES: DUF4058 family protein [unclassified Moorena]NEO10745.1 DUF4058 family protein [Moorena sp. SIO3I8]NEP23356.1 DUF4058 family protein [Moorena sp. SIO3I6]